MRPKISIIIPAYNAEKTIKMCVESICNQTYDNLEIIAVNDGSTDNTQAVLTDVAKADGRVKIIEIENGGVSHARNVGIDCATGDYITFVDADDTIKTDMYEHLIALIDKYNVKISHCSYNNVFEDGTESAVGNIGKEVLQSHDEALECLISGRLFAGGLWNKLYARELFANLRLDESIKYNEDILMNFKLFDRAESSVYSDRALYNYFANSSSSTHTAAGLRSGEETLSVSKQILDMSIGKPYERSAQIGYAYSSLCLYRAYLFSGDKNLKEKKRNLKAKIVSFYKDGCYPGKKEKITVWMCRLIPRLYKLLYKMYDKVRVKKLDPEQ